VSSSSIRPYLWMVSGCACFAVMSVLAHAAGERANWQTVAFSRSFLVLVFVGLYSASTGVKLAFLRPRQLWLRSLAGSFSLVTGFYALYRLPASTVTTLTSTYPIWVALLSWPMLRVLPTPRVWLGVLGGVLGVYLIQQPHGGADDFAVFVALVSAFGTSIAMLGLHRIKGVSPNAIVVHFSAVAAVCSAAAFLLFEVKSDTTPFYDPTVLSLLLGVGLTASFGQLFLTRAFSHGDPSRVAVVGLSQVVFTLIIDVIFTGHELTGPVVVGTLFILAPTAWVMMERRKRKRLIADVPTPIDGDAGVPVGAGR
jgi:drug/metabolite transporter (DMT)-like permease